jgi:hypothetical protein
LEDATVSEATHTLPPLAGAELDEAIAEYVAERCAPPDVTLLLAAAARQGTAQRLARGAERVRLIRLARRGKYRTAMTDYYPGVPHVTTASVKRSITRAYAHLLVVTATTNGAHSPTSLHRVKRAADFGNIIRHVGPTSEGRRRLVAYQRDEFNAWRRGRRPRLQELIGPDNHMVVLRGRHAPLPEGNPLENQHDNHVHEGFFS